MDDERKAAETRHFDVPDDRAHGLIGVSAHVVTNSNESRAVHGFGLLLAIAYLGFISLGLPDPVAGVAWPSVRETFRLQQSSFGLIFMGLGAGYCVSAFFGGKLTHVLGLGTLLWTSSALVAAAMFACGAAPAWGVIVAAAVVWGLGSGGIDAGLNAYVASHFSARHMNWLHACYSLGATLGPLLMTAMIVRFGSWRGGYYVVGSVLAAMAVLFLATGRRWDEPVPTANDEAASNDAEAAAINDAATAAVGIRTVLASGLVRLQIALFFLYVGLEFTVGQWAFTLLTESRGVSEELAGALAGGYYAAIGVGRIVSGAVASRIGLDRLLRVTMLIALGGTLVYAFGRSVDVGEFQLANIGLIIVGLGLAPVFPCLMARTPERLGKDFATHAVGFQVSGSMIGAALVPSAAGLLVERVGLESVGPFCVLLAALLFVVHERLLVASKKRA